MSTVPKFALYGTDSSPAWADLVNHERLPERSARYNWEIDPHVHEGLLQVLFVETGSPGEALIDGRRRPGLLTGVFCVGYGAARIVGELFREPDAHLGLLSLGMSMGQWLCLPMIVGGAVLWLWCARSSSAAR